MGEPSVSGTPPRRLSLPDPGLPESRLLQRQRRGEEEVFALLYEQYRLPLVHFCHALLGSPEEAEDAVQHTFMAAYRALGRGIYPQLPRAWLYSIARNQCLTILRARRGPALAPAVNPPDPLEKLEQRETLRELVGDMSELPDEQRVALVLREVSDLSHAEIGAIVGCDRAQVKSLIFRARESLREAREARQTPCETIRDQLASLRGVSLRRRKLRRHLETCPPCAEFRQQVELERMGAAAFAPWIALKGLLRLTLGGASGAGTPASTTLLGQAVSTQLSLLAVAVGIAASGGAIVAAEQPSRPEVDAKFARPPLPESTPALLTTAQLVPAEVPRLVRSPELLADSGDELEGRSPTARGQVPADAHVGSIPSADITPTEPSSGSAHQGEGADAETPERRDSPDRPEKADNPEKPEKADNPEKPEKADNPEKPAQAEKADNREKPEKADNPEKPAQAEKADNREKPEKPDRPDKPEKPEQAEKADRAEKPEEAEEPAEADEAE